MGRFGLYTFIKPTTNSLVEGVPEPQNVQYVLLLSENYINLNYVGFIHSAFQVYYMFLLLCIFILLIFESVILTLQLKILIYLSLKNNCNM